MYIYDSQSSDGAPYQTRQPVIIRPSQTYVVTRADSLNPASYSNQFAFGEPGGGQRTVVSLMNELTNLVFYARNPKLKGKKLKKGSKEAKQWQTIRQSEIIPALREPFTKAKICLKIFKARYPAAPDLSKAPKADQDKYGAILREIDKTEVGPIMADRLLRGPVNSRTIFVVNDLVFQRLPKAVRTALGAEIAECYAFVGAQDPKHPMTIVFVEPERLPMAYNFSDAVVRVVSSGATAALNEAIKNQRTNAMDFIESLGIRVRRDDTTRHAATPERLGVGTFHKEIITAGARKLAVPLIAAYVDLPEVIKEFKTFVSGLPNDIGKWDIQNKELLGKALGRTMAHEVRHTYITGHATDGLGTDSPQLMQNPKHERFTKDDQKDILGAIRGFEKLQGTATLVETLAPDKNLSF